MSKSGGIAYLLKHGRAPYPVTTRTEQPRLKRTKRMAEGGLPNANVPLNYGTVPDYVFVPGGMTMDEQGRPTWRSGRYELRARAPQAGATATGAVGVPEATRDIAPPGDGASSNPNWENMSAKDRAAFYADNPKLAALTQFGQKMFGLSSLGMLQNYMDPSFVREQGYIARGINPLGPEGYGTGGGSFAGMGFSGNEGMSVPDQYATYGEGRMAAEATTPEALAADRAATSMDAALGEAAGGVPSGTAPGYGETSFALGGSVPRMAAGGISALAPGGYVGSYARGGRMLKGPGDGLSDNIPAVIGKGQPARLADGEFVVSADAVSALGGGSTDAGARKLYAMMDRIRKNAHGSKKQVKKVNERKVLPA
jgi:hypothetical protein